MKRILTLCLCIAILLLAAGCRDSAGNTQADPLTSLTTPHSSSAPTTAVPPTTTSAPTPSTAPTTPTVAIPSVPMSPVAPVEGDENWGEHVGKVFVLEEVLGSDLFYLRGQYIELYFDGTFRSTYSAYVSVASETGTWTFEDNTLTLIQSRYNHELKEHVTYITQFAYSEGTLTLMKGERDLDSLSTVKDGTVFYFWGGITME